MVSEYFGSALPEVRFKIPSDKKIETIMKIFYHCAAGLNNIHQNDFVHHNLEPSNVLLDENYNVKLFNYG